MEAPELLGRIFSGGEEDGGWADAIPKVLGGLGELGKAVMAGQAAQQQGNQGGSQQGRTPRPDGQKKIPIQTPQGVKMITVDQLRDLRARQAAAAAKEHAQALPAQSFQPPGLQEGEALASGTAPAPAQAPAPVPVSPDEPEPDVSADYLAAVGVGVDTTARAKGAGLNLKKMRNARRALRALAKRLEKAGETQWEGLITASLVSEPAIFEYISAVSAYAAFAETKAPPALVEHVIAALRSSELVPDGSIPYNEADLVVFQAAAARAAARAAAAAAAAAEPTLDDQGGVTGMHGTVLPREDTDEQERS